MAGFLKIAFLCFSIAAGVTLALKFSDNVGSAVKWASDQGARVKEQVSGGTSSEE